MDGWIVGQLDGLLDNWMVGYMLYQECSLKLFLSLIICQFIVDAIGK